MSNETPDMTRASSAAVHGGGTGGGGSAAAVAAAPKASHRPVRRCRSLPLPRGARDVLRATWLAPSSGDQVAVTGDGWRQRQAKQNVPRLFLQNSCNLRFDVDRGKDLEMRIRHTYLTAMLAAASAALASTLAAAPPAAADCVSSGGPDPVTLCSQGESRVSNTTPLPAATPYIPY